MSSERDYMAGMLSDAYGLQFAMEIVPLICMAAAAVFLLAARTYQADRRRVGDVEPELDFNQQKLPTRLTPEPESSLP